MTTCDTSDDLCSWRAKVFHQTQAYQSAVLLLVEQVRSPRPPAQLLTKKKKRRGEGRLSNSPGVQDRSRGLGLSELVFRLIGSGC